jgi:hypothetical protein
MELFPALGFVLVLLILLAFFLHNGRGLRESLPLAAGFAIFLALYFMLPFQWIVRWMPARFQPFVFIMLLLWLAALAPDGIRRLHRRTIAAVGLTILLASTTIKAGAFERLNGYYEEYASAAPHIVRNSTLIGLRLHNSLDGRPFPAKAPVLIQACSRIASERHSMDLKNFQGQAREHPILFRPGVGATAALGGNQAMTARPPRLDLMGYERQTGRAIDYVMLYGYREAVADQAALEKLDVQLRAHYRRVYVSAPSGFVQLYVRQSDSKITQNDKK